jgi:hypothetical protein
MFYTLFISKTFLSVSIFEVTSIITVDNSSLLHFVSTHKILILILKIKQIFYLMKLQFTFFLLTIYYEYYIRLKQWP